MGTFVLKQQHVDGMIPKFLASFHGQLVDFACVGKTPKTEDLELSGGAQCPGCWMLFEARKAQALEAVGDPPSPGGSTPGAHVSEGCSGSFGLSR